jgi:hypothetical protein
MCDTCNNEKPAQPMNSTNNVNSIQLWFDLVVMPPMDPRGLISTAALEDSGGTMRSATFARAQGWLLPGPWIQTPLNVSTPTGSLIPNVTVPNSYDYASIEDANTWNTLHQMVAINPSNLPFPVQNTMFLKAGSAFVNNLFIDFKAAVTSVQVMLTFRDNAVTSGTFQNSGTATLPVFAFPSATYGSTGRNLQVTALRPGRFQMGLTMIDNSGNVSMFPMDWIVE